ncbi:hypothetical protein ZIOFF_074359 (mitochondrion) [Zingiber officinale]|uniref:Uncharacterized protein n=1 Tax=Zingiber officinale TaxID=94328 RepID=A0A8J5CRB3_ZINOF|nr:hypothetical protein ZIOFF_074359 [Zingiber officinale]
MPSLIVRRLAAYQAEKRMAAASVEVVDCESAEDEIEFAELEMAPAKLDDLRAEVQDALEEVNLGTESDRRMTFISKNLEPELKKRLIRLLHTYKDCFAWDYTEMPGSEANLVEHRLPIKPGKKPYKQPPRRMSTEIFEIYSTSELFISERPPGEWAGTLIRSKLAFKLSIRPSFQETTSGAPLRENQDLQWEPCPSTCPSCPHTGLCRWDDWAGFSLALA